MKEKIYNLIREDDENGVYSNLFDWTIIGLIIINICLVILDTFNLSSFYEIISSKIEFFSIVVFTIEYLLRVWTSTFQFNQLTPIKARLKYIFSFMAIVDLLAILPFYIPLIITIDLRALRTLRLVRLLRILKFNRYSDSMMNIIDVFKKKKFELLSSFFVVMLLMIISSVIMYNLENSSQPESFNNALSGLWWAVATFTTVGYGDIYPITIGGKFMAGIISILGIGLVAVPTGIISAGFVESIKVHDIENKQKKYCPYCGEKLE